VRGVAGVAMLDGATADHRPVLGIEVVATTQALFD
jgi:hypothetical protein